MKEAECVGGMPTYSSRWNTTTRDQSTLPFWCASAS
jgi:hypothetical protein